MLIKYFTKTGEGWQIIKPIRDMADFREWNLLRDFSPLGRFDVVFWRNVLIYFDAPTKARVLDMLASRIVPGGLLYLGGAETINGLGGSFRAVPGEHFVFEPTSRCEADASRMPLLDA